MAGNFLTDVVQIDPGSGQVLTIGRTGSGSLTFADEDVPSVTLKGLASLSQVSNVIIVGKSGAGASHTTVQAALDAVSASSNAASPTVVVIGPGTYTENLILEKDGVILFGLGRVVLSASSAAATFRARANVSTTPRYFEAHHVTFENSFDGEECVYLEGAAISNVAADGFHFHDCVFEASGAGTFQIFADTVNDICLDGCRMDGSSSTSLVRLTQVASFDVSSSDLVNIQMDYDSGNPAPVNAGCDLVLRSVDFSGNIQSTLTGVGSLRLSRVVSTSPTRGDVNFAGDRTLSVEGSTLRDLVLGAGTQTSVRVSSYNSVSGSGVLDLDVYYGSVSFAASASESVTFPLAFSDDQYHVSVEPSSPVVWGVSAKLDTGFTLDLSVAATVSANYKVSKKI